MSSQAPRAARNALGLAAVGCIYGCGLLPRRSAAAIRLRIGMHVSTFTGWGIRSFNLSSREKTGAGVTSIKPWYEAPLTLVLHNQGVVGEFGKSHAGAVRMSSNTLNGLKGAILVTDGFEQVEMREPRKALDEAGAATSIVSPKIHQVRGWNFTDWGAEFPVDHALDKASPQDFDALLLPGGVINPDKLRI